MAKNKEQDAKEYDAFVNNKFYEVEYVFWNTVEDKAYQSDFVKEILDADLDAVQVFYRIVTDQRFIKTFGHYDDWTATFDSSLIQHRLDEHGVKVDGMVCPKEHIVYINPNKKPDIYKLWIPLHEIGHIIDFYNWGNVMTCALGHGPSFCMSMIVLYSIFLGEDFAFGFAAALDRDNIAWNTIHSHHTGHKLNRLYFDYNMAKIQYLAGNIQLRPADHRDLAYIHNSRLDVMQGFRPTPDFSPWLDSRYGGDDEA